MLGEPLYCITPALDGCLSHLDRIPHTWTMTSFNICSTVLYKYDILALIHHYSFCLICFCLICFHPICFHPICFHPICFHPICFHPICFHPICLHLICFCLI